MVNWRAVEHGVYNCHLHKYSSLIPCQYPGNFETMNQCDLPFCAFLSTGCGSSSIRHACGFGWVGCRGGGGGMNKCKNVKNIYMELSQIRKINKHLNLFIYFPIIFSFLKSCENYLRFLLKWAYNHAKLILKSSQNHLNIIAKS